MREAERTTRQRLADVLREHPDDARGLSTELGVPTSVVYDHLEHVARSLDGTDEQFLVAPPQCNECDFSDFDDPLNDPSRCPRCRSESLRPPTFTIE
ncbi:MAG: transcriptional regulator [Halobacteriota archaeon]